MSVHNTSSKLSSTTPSVQSQQQGSNLTFHFRNFQINDKVSKETDRLLGDLKAFSDEAGSFVNNNTDFMKSFQNLNFSLTANEVTNKNTNENFVKSSENSEENSLESTPTCDHTVNDSHQNDSTFKRNLLEQDIIVHSNREEHMIPSKSSLGQINLFNPNLTPNPNTISQNGLKPDFNQNLTHQVNYFDPKSFQTSRNKLGTCVKGLSQTGTFSNIQQFHNFASNNNQNQDSHIRFASQNNQNMLPQTELISQVHGVYHVLLHSQNFQDQNFGSSHTTNQNWQRPIHEAIENTEIASMPGEIPTRFQKLDSQICPLGEFCLSKSLFGKTHPSTKQNLSSAMSPLCNHRLKFDKVQILLRR